MENEVCERKPRLVSDSMLYVGGFNTGTVEKMKESRRAFVSLARLIESGLPNSRERSLALTQLEQSQMYCMKAICLAAPEGKQENPFE